MENQIKKAMSIIKNNRLRINGKLITEEDINKANKKIEKEFNDDYLRVMDEEKLSALTDKALQENYYEDNE